MTRRLAHLGLIAVATGLLFMGAGLPAQSQTDVICSSWTWDGADSVVVPDHSSQLWLQSYHNACGERKYRAQGNNGSNSVISITLSIRVWVCGVSKPGAYQPLTLNPGQYGEVSVVYYYGSCGRQADNYDTYIYGVHVYHSPTTYMSF